MRKVKTALAVALTIILIANLILLAIGSIRSGLFWAVLLMASISSFVLNKYVRI